MDLSRSWQVAQLCSRPKCFVAFIFAIAGSGHVMQSVASKDDAVAGDWSTDAGGEPFSRARAVEVPVRIKAPARTETSSD